MKQELEMFGKTRKYSLTAEVKTETSDAQDY